jgi:alpha-N-arabinofuranosidase
MMHSDGPKATLARVVALLDEAGCRGRVKIAFDEWNLRGWHHPGFPRKEVGKPGDKRAERLIAQRQANDIASQYTMADALFSASFLNACLRHADDVGMANIAPIVNTRGPLFVHPRGIVKRTTFHTLAMYANLLEARVGKLDLSCGELAHQGHRVPVVDAVATVNDSGKKWSLALINRHPTLDVDCTVKLGGALWKGTCQLTTLAGDTPDVFNDIENPDRVTPVKSSRELKEARINLPAHSLTIIQISAP